MAPFRWTFSGFSPRMRLTARTVAAVVAITSSLCG
jgi:hypothetical protein